MIPPGGWIGRLLHPVYGLLRLIGAHVRDFHAAVGAFLFIGLALLIGAVVSFAELAEMVAEGEIQAVEHPSDVLAGFAVGLAWATFCALGIEAIVYFRGRRPGVDEHEKDLAKGTEPLQDAVSRHHHPAA